MANVGNDNLIPYRDRTAEEQREFHRSGGIASGAARRRKRDLKNAADLLLSMKATPKQRADMAKLGIDADDADLQMAMLVAQLQQAMKGNTKAAALFVSLLEDSQQKQTINSDDMANVADFIRRNADVD